MTPRVYTKLLAVRQTADSEGLHDLFTVPAGHTFVVVDAAVFAQNATATFLLFDSTNSVVIARWESVASGDFFRWEGRQAFEAGSTLQSDALTGAWQVRVTGYDFLG
jgi:phosphoserine aminotransferase